ncbi:unnamed protein product [Gongylonema pulchrum]|uniref:F-box domain-containing protein n=1 Tax=Gongylonema pulchrum TaxID=637853 RepID=A0A183EER5_9BILA|nr:unnamed protein product [Gongylonema pulchrum]
MLDLLSGDIIWRIFRYLDVGSRARLAAVNTTFYRLFNKWEDLLHCSVRLDGITLAGENFVIERKLVTPVFDRCPLIRKLAVHDERVLWKVDREVLRSLVNINELHISSNFFAEGSSDATIAALFSFPRLQVLHIQQRYSEEKCQLNIVRPHHVLEIASASLSDLKLQGVVVTAQALELICSKYRNTLESLCLLGGLVSTSDLHRCFQAISKCSESTHQLMAHFRT